jgi:hypothetical protein
LQQNKQEKLDKVPVSEAHNFFLTIYIYIYFNKSVQCCLRKILQFFWWKSTFSFIFHSLYFQFYQWNIHKPGKSRELPLHSGAALPCLSTGLTSSKEIPKGRLFAFDPEGQYLMYLQWILSITSSNFTFTLNCIFFNQAIFYFNIHCRYKFNQISLAAKQARKA